MDRKKQQSENAQKYVYQEWPAFRFGPDGQQQVFQSEEEVPEGWADHPSKVGKRGVTKTQTAAAAEDHQHAEPSAASELCAKYTDDEIVAALEHAAKANPKVEFLKAWPKLRKAEVIVQHKIVMPAKDS